MTTALHARQVLADAEGFTLPFDVSRQPIRDQAETRKHTPPLSREATSLGLEVLLAELDATMLAPGPVDTMQVLRDPVARSTTAALVPEADDSARETVAEHVLAWIDSLAPIISPSRPPHRWSQARRQERRAREVLTRALVRLGCRDALARGTALAAGVQVPISAGAWAMTQLACRPALTAALRSEPDLAVAVAWETLRMFPPTWQLPRITTRSVSIGSVEIAPYQVVIVSPVTLGLLPDLAPGPDASCSPLDEFDPLRWAASSMRPGAWLPFGAGQHACPGRHLGLAQVQEIAIWAVTSLDLSSPAPPTVDSSRGLAPRPSIVEVVEVVPPTGQRP